MHCRVRYLGDRRVNERDLFSYFIYLVGREEEKMRFKREADAYGVATARNGVRPISRERCYLLLLLLLLLAIDDLSTRRRGTRTVRH